MEPTLALNNPMLMVLGLMALTMYLFVSEIVRVDVAAVLVMVLLGILGLVPAERLFGGFASNAVISIIAVMIIGAGLDRTGLMTRVAGEILRVGGRTERRIIPLVSGTVAFISSFMQNVGAAALFLPVVSRISSRTGISLSRLAMPMGFCAILGGTMTMIGSSPLILLNDLLHTANHALPEAQHMEDFHLFDVTPIGIALVATGILYFVYLGNRILPSIKVEMADAGNALTYFKDTYGIHGDLFELRVPAESPLVGKTVEQVELLADHKLILVAMTTGNEKRVAPARDVAVQANSVLAFIGSAERVRECAEKQRLKITKDLAVFAEILTPMRAGIAEIVVPPSSPVVGKTLKDVRMRQTYGSSVLAIHRGGETITSGLRNTELRAGDTLAIHTTWDDLAAMEKGRNFVVVTQNYPHEELRPNKVGLAVLFFAIALGLILFTDTRLSLALLVGAVGMIMTGVLTMDEAYQAVSWKSVFLLASLIPLGLAVQTTGTAAWIAQEVLRMLNGVPAWVLQAAIAALATFFTLVMSNVGATVLLVPLAVSIALGAGADPRMFALTVALATSNSFFLPTHQVNALIMGPGGYRVRDFMRAGGVMTVLYLVVLIGMLNLVF